MNPDYKLFILFCLGFSIAFMCSCKHEPFGINVEPIDPNPNPNPLDTSGTSGVPCDEDLIYFERDVLPILISNCSVSGCHDPASAEDGVILTSYANVLATTELIPFQPSESEIYENITDTDPDKIMPPPERSPLTTEQINIIGQWIQQGAQNLTCDASSGGCDTLNVSYSLNIFPLIQNKCLGCHSGTNPGGGLNFSTHTGLQSPALDGTLIGALTSAPGYSPMPQNGSQLPSCDIRKIELWIGEGALNN